MVSKVFSVVNTLENGFLFPVPFVNEATALRTFRDSVRNPQSNFFKHPEEFVLYEVGTFDDESGVLASLPAPRMVATALSLVEVK